MALTEEEFDALCILISLEQMSIIDEYVYTLSDNEIRGYQREVNKILGED